MQNSYSGLTVMTLHLIKKAGKKTLRGHVKVEKHKNKIKMRRMNFKSIVFKFKYLGNFVLVLRKTFSWFN